MRIPMDENELRWIIKDKLGQRDKQDKNMKKKTTHRTQKAARRISLNQDELKMNN